MTLLSTQDQAPERHRYVVDPRIEAKVGNAICITGIARSGTTLMGKLLHSLRSVEYAFEPQSLVPLFLLMDEISVHAWRLLYQTYLFDEILMNGLAGRSLNFNPKDDSYIYLAKSQEEIARRFDESHRYKELFASALTRTIAYKLPNILPATGKLASFYPETRFLVMLRHPDAVVLSLKRKGWFKRTVPTYAETGLLKTVSGQVVPALIADEDAASWVELSETDRCYHFYIQMQRHLPDAAASIFVDYDRFVHRAPAIFSEITRLLKLEPGEKTAGLISEIAPPYADYPVPEDAARTLREEAIEVYQGCRQAAL